MTLQFPFHSSHPVKCSQGNAQYDGSHNHPDIIFAIDLSSLPNSPAGVIHAAKDGIAYVYDKCKDTSGTTGYEYNNDPCAEGYGNHVRIVHDDGYLTIYAHLARILIDDKAYVNTGQTIGIEGNSGRAGLRHLHFGLHKPHDLEYYIKKPGWVGKSVPFYFKIRYENEIESKLSSSLEIKCDQTFNAPLIFGVW